jgi:Tfp pilus assembly protein PilO
MGTGVTLLLLIMIASGIYINSKLKELNGDIKSSKEAFSVLEQKRTKLEQLRSSVIEFEEKIEVHKNTDLSAFLSKSSQKSGIKEKILDRVKEKNSSKAGFLTQKSYNVPLKEISLSDFTSFLYEIETAGYPFEIQQCSIRTRKRGDEQKLRIELDIVTYQLNKTREAEQ